MLFPQWHMVAGASLVIASSTAFSPSLASFRPSSTFGVSQSQGRPFLSSIALSASGGGDQTEGDSICVSDSGSASVSVSEAQNDATLLQNKIQQIADEHVLDHVCHNPITSLSLEDYKSDHATSIESPQQYWFDKATELLSWDRPPASAAEVLSGSFAQGDVTWFAGSKLNVCYNAIDRYALQDPNRVAIRWEGDDPSDVLEITFAEAQREVSRIANALKSKGVRKGDVVTLYMPMLPALPLTMLACARIGAVHSVVFAGFSAEALAARIDASDCKYVVTADQGIRGGRGIPLKNTVDAALDLLAIRSEATGDNIVDTVFVFERYFDKDKEVDGEDGDTVTELTYEPTSKDVRMNVLVNAQRPYCPCESMDAEDPLFILYTSGSTGQPKGVVHTTGGYALYAMHTTREVFDLKNTQHKHTNYACVADCGWITGHTYITYGPLLNGCSTFVFESTPLYPDAGRYWDMIERHKISVLYTAPTAIRSLMRFGDDVPAKYDLSSLRILGTVGEPINPEAWRWYFEIVGRNKCTVVDTYWQTETGGHIITNLPGSIPMKPGSCTLPFYGIDTVVLDPVSGKELTEINSDDEEHVEGVIAIRQPWPGMARTCLGDHERYMNVYFEPYAGYYFCGDAVKRDRDGYYWITGRVDDVINVSGHRIGTAEVESALVAHPAVAQAAVVGIPHDIKGQGICGYVTLTEEYLLKENNENDNESLIKELRMLVRTAIGPFATPDIICPAAQLPMTRSGKIMRRILRKIATKETDALGDISGLSDPSSVEYLIEQMKKYVP